MQGICVSRMQDALSNNRGPGRICVDVNLRRQWKKRSPGRSWRSVCENLTSLVILTPPDQPKTVRSGTSLIYFPVLINSRGKLVWLFCCDVHAMANKIWFEKVPESTVKISNTTNFL